MIQYTVQSNAGPPSGGRVALVPDRNLITGERDFVTYFGGMSSIEYDLLLLAASIFAADRATARGEREDFCRHIEISVPVASMAELVPLKTEVEEILRVLSSDAWRIVFRSAGSTSRPEFEPVQTSSGRTLLFSGGLDSLAAAFQFGSGSDQTFLVSHITRNRPTRVAQSALVEALSSRGLRLPHYQFFVSSQADEAQAFDHDVETSQRTRSFLFVVLGALAAHRLGSSEILMMAENGQMAVHLPLTNARIGAFSTHTAHPDVLVAMQRFLSAALGYPISIVNPFIHSTKAEVIREIARDCADLIPLSESCWRNTRLPQDFTHCGECIPCYVRRIAVETWIPDPTAYLRDPWRQDFSSAPEDDTAYRNLCDLVEFVLRVSQYSVEEMTNEWPELYSPNLSAPQIINMYKRFASEALAVWRNYPVVEALLR
jgi:7-cyano-7-deazaguanine synthase in queuosine biosynthesis